MVEDLTKTPCSSMFTFTWTDGLEAVVPDTGAGAEQAITTQTSTPCVPTDRVRVGGVEHT